MFIKPTDSKVQFSVATFHLSWVPEAFFSLGVTELSAEAWKANLELGSFLAVDDREDLWYSEYILIRGPAGQPTYDQVLLR